MASEPTTVAAPLPGTAAATEISVVLPVRNEQESLGELDRELRDTLLAMDRCAEIIYVDDHSTDGSSRILEDLVNRAVDGRVRTRVITLRRNYGQTAAMAAGIDLAEGDAVLTLDADGQNNPADIPRLFEKLEEGYDVVCGWRKDRKDEIITRIIPSRVANWIISKIEIIKFKNRL